MKSKKKRSEQIIHPKHITPRESTPTVLPEPQNSSRSLQSAPPSFRDRVKPPVVVPHVASACHQFSPDRCMSECLSSVIYKASFGDDASSGSKKLEATVTRLLPSSQVTRFSHLHVVGCYQALYRIFFNWVSKRGENGDYTPGSRSYNEILDVLGRMKRFEQLNQVLDEMSKRKGVVNERTFGILLNRYAADHRIDEAIEIFYKRREFGPDYLSLI